MPISFSQLVAPMLPGFQCCSKCLIVKAISDFYLKHGSRTGHRSECIECIKAASGPLEAAKRWQRANQEKVKKARIAYMARTKEKRKEYDRLKNIRKSNKRWAAAPARPADCEICHRPGEPTPSRAALKFDHDHATGLFRGWICDRCNRVLGSVRDSPALLIAMVKYLEGANAIHKETSEVSAKQSVTIQ